LETIAIQVFILKMISDFFVLFKYKISSYLRIPINENTINKYNTIKMMIKLTEDEFGLQK
jgi:hypothetical protein